MPVFVFVSFSNLNLSVLFCFIFLYFYFLLELFCFIFLYFYLPVEAVVAFVATPGGESASARGETSSQDQTHCKFTSLNIKLFLLFSNTSSLYVVIVLLLVTANLALTIYTFANCFWIDLPQMPSIFPQDLVFSYCWHCGFSHFWGFFSSWFFSPVLSVLVWGVAILVLEAWLRETNQEIIGKQKKKILRATKFSIKIFDKYLETGQ